MYGPGYLLMTNASSVFLLLSRLSVGHYKSSTKLVKEKFFALQASDGFGVGRVEVFVLAVDGFKFVGDPFEKV